MKIDNHLDPKEKTEISVEKKQQIEYELIGKIIPHNGHAMWEINNETQEIVEAKFIEGKKNRVTVSFGITYEIQKKEILQRKGFTYVSALNKENALRKFRQGKTGSKDILKDKWKL